jgi:2-oxoglutarate ferredoxin oxidoreductase subunit beta
MGVFRAIEKPTYDEEVNQQVKDAIAEKGEGDLEKLFNRGDTWEVK